MPTAKAVIATPAAIMGLRPRVTKKLRIAMVAALIFLALRADAVANAYSAAMEERVATK